MEDEFAEILPPRWLSDLVWNRGWLSVTLGHTQNVFCAGDFLTQPPDATPSLQNVPIFFPFQNSVSW